MQCAPEATVSLGQVFTLLFVMLGPLKILGPFAARSHDMEVGAVRKIAFLAFVLALIAVLAGGFIGRGLARSWGISPPVLLLAGGVIFALVGLKLLMEQYESAHTPPPLPAAPLPAAMQVAFPTIVTPYGIAALIVLLANSHDAARTQGVLAMLGIVMALNLLAMLLARSIMRGVGVVALQLLGAVLGVLQVALAISIILRALYDLKVIGA
jgi:multiple antibiotic resistance protein